MTTKYPQINHKALTAKQKKEFDAIKDSVTSTLVNENTAKTTHLTLSLIDIMAHNIATNLLGVIK